MKSIEVGPDIVKARGGHVPLPGIPVVGRSPHDPDSPGTQTFGQAAEVAGGIGIVPAHPREGHIDRLIQKARRIGVGRQDQAHSGEEN